MLLPEYLLTYITLVLFILVLEVYFHVFFQRSMRELLLAYITKHFLRHFGTLLKTDMRSVTYLAALLRYTTVKVYEKWEWTNILCLWLTNQVCFHFFYHPTIFDCYIDTFNLTCWLTYRYMISLLHVIVWHIDLIFFGGLNSFMLFHLPFPSSPSEQEPLLYWQRLSGWYNGDDLYLI